MKRFYLSLLALLCLSLHSFAQNNDEKYIIHIKKSKSPLKLDGILDEDAWQVSDIAKDFFLNRPFDSSFAKLQTEVRVTFDDNFVYVGAKVFQNRKTYTTSSLKRDFAGGTSDVFVVNFDTFNDKLNAFHFAVSPYNVQREGLLSASSEEVSLFWDNKWYSEVKNYDDYWSIEMAIPFKTLRYKINESTNIWRINFGRNCLKQNEISTWRPVPRNFPPSNTAYTGQLIWDDAPPKPGANISLIPFVTGGINKDFPRDEETLKPFEASSNTTKGIGMDAKIAVTPSLNLDLTVNPDFSQVEVDRQVANLSRFELFFPERRQFFLENNDLFGTFGFPDTRPFFSRRIGITRNPNTGLNQRVPILAGARLSGKVNNTLRVGLMNMQTRKVDFGENKFLPAANYSVITLQQKVLNRSTIGGIFTNKENFLNDFTPDQKANYRAYNRIGGLEFNYYSKDNRFESETYYHQSISPDKAKDASSIAHYMGYHHPNIDLNLGMQRIGENYRADAGFVPRTGIYQFYRPVNFILNPKNSKISKYINAYGIGVEGSDVFSLKGKHYDTETNAFAFISTPTGGEGGAGWGWSYTYLFSPFDPTNASDNPNPDLYKNVIELPDSTVYRYNYFIMGFETSPRNTFVASAEFSKGKYFNGKATFFEGSLSYRIQPYGILTLDYSYNKISLPKPYNSIQYWLIGPKAELSFTRSVFFSTFFQYNTQTNNVNINSRLQWRFKPVSDLFLVYTDNYFAESIPNYRVNAWMPKNRALILKITYWLNV